MPPGPKLDDLAPDPTAIGQVSTPPFAIVPDPQALFSQRASRLRTYASVSPMKAYLEFVASIADAQAELIQSLPTLAPIDPDRLSRSADFAMPPVDRSAVVLDDAIRGTLDGLFARLGSVPMPLPASTALDRVRRADVAETERRLRDVLDQSPPADELAEHGYLAAGLQVHFARLAASLDAERLKPVGDGVCPVCGGAPLASLIVERPNAHGSRYCACAMCATQWNFVRIRCCSCGSTKGVGYQEVEGAGGAVKAETCDECRTYVKVMYQNRDAAIEPAADDIGTLPLDLLMKSGPYRRSAFNPFLLAF